MERIKEMDRLLILEDGTVFKGKGFGSDNFRIGELVFNTSMTGYQEILTDNSYYGQIIIMTYPLIGNYGINSEDNESINSSAFGFVIKDYCEYDSNFRSLSNLDDFLKEEGVPGIHGIDTRELTKKIREKGTMKATLASADADVDKIVEKLRSSDFLHDQVEKVSTKRIYEIPNVGKKVVLLDFGAKNGIIKELLARDCNLVVMPYNTSAKKIFSFHPDAVVLSNGPGNPEDLDVLDTIRELVDKTVVFGICLGHQLICLSQGASTYKLKFGHRGGNHPVKDLVSSRVYISSQNHSFAVREESLRNKSLEISHVSMNDGSVEGVRHKTRPCFSVQYHPEASAGPHDSKYLFDEFIDLIERNPKNA